MEAPGLGASSGRPIGAGAASWAGEAFSVVITHVLNWSAPQALRVPSSSPETKIPQSIQINCFMVLSSFLCRLWFPLL